VEHRAAFWTIRAEEAAGASELFHLTGSKVEDIDAFLTIGQEGTTIEAHQDGAAGARWTIPREAVFELYQARTSRRWRDSLTG